MNKEKTSQEEIMKICRHIVAQEGLNALNMRYVAKECQIALGTLYHYYDNKYDLLISTVESIWKDIFHMNQSYDINVTFYDYVYMLFKHVLQGIEKYPHFLTTHALVMEKCKKSEGISVMEHYFEHMKKAMCKILENDQKIREDAFVSLDKEEFISFVLDSIILLLFQEKKNCSVLLEMIHRTIY